jgi:PKD repeat protein
MAQISAKKDKVNCFTPEVQFRNYSLQKSGTSVSYSWSFAGCTPSTSTLENPIVNYGSAAPGSYNVTLTVTDQYGSNSQTLTNFIKVVAAACPVETSAGKAIICPHTLMVLSIK